MRPYLVFGLTATLGSMGELAGHERRGSLAWPGRSAILGLLGAAMGIERGGDFSELDALDLAVAVFDRGAPLRDYHTVQTVPSAAAKRPNSRPEALAAARGRLNTAITLRDYRSGVFYGVAVWGDGLEALEAALNRPHYTLYFGRKSCPLAAPPGAKVVQAVSPEAALAHLTPPPWRCAESAAMDCVLVCDAAEGDALQEEVQDVPRDRALWHFGRRRIALRDVTITLGGAA
ncbi:type I-E CRISPR-associated protein Cas5/CasD [Rhodovulum adriaticum]|uniref:CRISPR system Cascade subunit CasD n=1 Tax=Rhodovulum adriaticum TaxID=35804 RepID=A0A4R2P0X0_RHOAD|nr:type I-E CRISPR-associated protein Cas5/CasD [Rhodovulum adriaticum]MBK1634166.1 type I-E CRISPR-associated protein Cas5/CasD [Rhodovulum adriaticum]TCP27285.1 CRISPR system Cascade subunit CasD [Rhodovulum adriaticum]